MITWYGDENGVTPPIDQYYFGTFDGRTIKHDTTRFIDAVVPLRKSSGLQSGGVFFGSFM